MRLRARKARKRSGSLGAWMSEGPSSDTAGGEPVAGAHMDGGASASMVQIGASGDAFGVSNFSTSAIPECAQSASGGDGVGGGAVTGAACRAQL